jgi:multidrug efflux pump subunit AcrA (membrane-fusion protein)
MNATVDFRAQAKKNILIIPVGAVHKEKGQDYVFVKEAGRKEPIKRGVKLGITDDKNVEVLSGIDLNDKIIIKIKRYTLPKNNVGKNPFSPIGQHR